ncbi:hypothetical protein G3M58_66775 [Streptomyces sp. SID7499]|uniref:Uncharacterized protein n=1 Tax=Streptomyces sp. SID7499 TaxID=2706086 RepID=A0A6G3XJ66_9ACTN|nr:hypothetical protein [Streptomyces sp. SID7499]
MAIDLRAPDGTNRPFNSLTLQYVCTLRRFSSAVIWARCGADWEEAGVVYLNDVRQPRTIGNYRHDRFATIPEANFDQKVAIAGWHKQSAPDSRKPWVASHGRIRPGSIVPGGLVAVAEWDDSWDHGIGDFDDLITEVQRLSGTVHPIGG